MAQFLIESLVISFVGGIFGIFLGLLSSFLLSKLAGWSIAFNAFSISLSFLFSSFIGIVFGLWPAYKARI